MAVDGHLNFDTKINETGFKKGIKSLGNGLDSIRNKLGGIGAALAAAFSVKVIKDFSKECKSLYDTQLEAEARLAQVMRNTMDSTEDQIQAVKGYSSALQELGVIGDEVQLSGLQELATYLSESDSLKKMNVVLNDMLAQQYGLNATAESAVTIATMLGKVLDGQTGALSRYGYSFTEAQEQLLKFGTEEQRVATLAEVVEASVGGMNAALANTNAGRMKQLDNTIGDIKEQFGQAVYQIEVLFLPALRQLADLLAKAASFAQSLSGAIAKVFGSETKTAESAAQAADSYDDMAQAAEAAEEANEGSLASFDEINKLGGEDSDETAETAADTALSGGALNLTVTADTVEADEKMVAFLTKLKKNFIKSRDFIKNIFTKLKTWLYDNFGGTFEGIFNGLADEGRETLGILKGIFSDIKTLAKPLKAWFNNDLVPYWKAEFATLGSIVTGLYDTFNKVFSDIWNIAVFPILSNFVTDGLPMITQFGTEVWTALGVLFENVKSLFDKLWSEYAAPYLTILTEIWTDTVSILKAKWDEYGKPIFDGLKETFSNVTAQLKLMLDKWVKPVFDYTMEAADELWNDHLSPLLDEILGLVGDVILAAQSIYNKVIAPIIRWLTAKLAPVVTIIGRNIVDGIKTRVANITDLFRGIVKFLRGIFTLDLATAWTGICEVFSSAWEIIKTAFGLDKVKEFFTGVVDAIADIFSGLGEVIKSPINAVIDAINGAFATLNSFSIDIPHLDGSVTTFGFNIPEIPRLAQGTVVPANYGEFLAVLGDNRREAEVVSPVSSIKQAVMEALVELGGTGRGGSNQPLVVKIMLDGRVVGQAAIDDINDRTKRNGRSPLK